MLWLCYRVVAMSMSKFCSTMHKVGAVQQASLRKAKIIIYDLHGAVQRVDVLALDVYDMVMLWGCGTICSRVSESQTTELEPSGYKWH